MIAVNATIDLVAIVEVSFSTYNVSTYEFNMIIIRDNNVLTTDVNGDRMGIVKCEGKVREDVWGLWRYREVIRHPVPKRSDARHRAIASCEKLTPQNHGINKFAYAPWPIPSFSILPHVCEWEPKPLPGSFWFSYIIIICTITNKSVHTVRLIASEEARAFNSRWCAVRADNNVSAFSARAAQYCSTVLWGRSDPIVDGRELVEIMALDWIGVPPLEVLAGFDFGGEDDGWPRGFSGVDGALEIFFSLFIPN